MVQPYSLVMEGLLVKARLFVFAHRSRTKTRATRVILDIKVLILL